MQIDNLKDKRILITGATSGIGKSLTLKLIKIGAKVAFCGRSKTKLDELLKEILGDQNNYYSESFDITIERDIKKFVKNAIENLGGVDILINCAGANTAKSFVKDIETSDLEYMLKLNAIGPFIFMREVYDNMVNNDTGIIINVLSTVCNFSNEGIGAYTASKASLDALVKVFRKEARDYIRVCSIYPGGVNTSFRDMAKSEYLKAEEVADSIILMMLFEGNASVDELVIRPMIEKNYI